VQFAAQIESSAAQPTMRPRCIQLSTRRLRVWVSQFRAWDDRPWDVPSHPDETYANEGWVDWYDWLGKPAHGSWSADVEVGRRLLQQCMAAGGHLKDWFNLDETCLNRDEKYRMTVALTANADGTLAHDAASSLGISPAMH
jgi:hypothetical protein